MNKLNGKRILIGTAYGSIASFSWSNIIAGVVLGIASKGERHLPNWPRQVYLFLFFFLLAAICAWFYAAVRGTLGAGLKTALTVGLVVGFAAVIPFALWTANWTTMPWVRWDPMVWTLPFLWMTDIFGGAVIATLVAARVYRD